MATATVALPRATPRDQAVVRAAVPLYRGILPGLFFGGLMFAGALACPALAVLAPLPTAGVRLFLGGFGTVLFAFLGVLSWLPARERLRRRLAALIAGEPVTATVESQGRVSVAWKSWQDYALTLKLPDGHTVRVESADVALHEAHPVGSTVTVLWAPAEDACFCPAELGLEVRFESEAAA